MNCSAVGDGCGSGDVPVSADSRAAMRGFFALMVSTICGVLRILLFLRTTEPFRSTIAAIQALSVSVMPRLSGPAGITSSVLTVAPPAAGTDGT